MSYVYFTRVDGWVKIGYSYNPEARAKTILKGSPVPELMDQSKPRKVLHQIPNATIRDKRRLHEHFAPFHAVGEWYHYTPVLARMLRDLEFETIYEQRLRIRREKAAAKQVA